jgi:hypothetical protein
MLGEVSEKPGWQGGVAPPANTFLSGEAGKGNAAATRAMERRCLNCDFCDYRDFHDDSGGNHRNHGNHDNHSSRPFRRAGFLVWSPIFRERKGFP